MKRILCVTALLLLPLALTSCDEQRTIDTIRTGQTAVRAAGEALYASLNLAHATGQLSDEKWAAFLKLWQKYATADQLLTDGLATWEPGAGKPLLERLQALFANLNTLIADINSLIEAWGKTAAAGFHPIRV